MARGAEAEPHRIEMKFAPIDHATVADPRGATVSFYLRMQEPSDDVAVPPQAKGLSRLRTAALAIGDSKPRLFVGVGGNGSYQIVTPGPQGASVVDGGKPGNQRTVRWETSVTRKGV